MKRLLCTLIILVSSQSFAGECPKALDTEVRKLHSNDDLNPCTLYKDSKALLIVNTASHCGFTKQFGGLEALNKKYADQGLTIIGFPSNNFKQEEKEEEATARVCYQNYGVTFPMTEHTVVKGADVHPIFKYLADKSESPSWNFNKYLIDANGKVTHFGSMTTPLDSQLETDIISALKLN